VTIPDPVPGLVIRYSFLWSTEARKGLGESRKDRPAAIVVTTKREDGDLMVIVAPITHVEPSDLEASLEIPHGERQWLRLDELNRFAWPGFDLRPVPGTQSCAYGMLPEELYNALRRGILDRQRSRNSRSTEVEEGHAALRRRVGDSSGSAGGLRPILLTASRRSCS
jgi:hypothetical protein